MIKYLRPVLSIILLLIVICTVAVLSLVYFIDPNKLKPLLISKIEQRTGYQVDIIGNLSWSFYPRLAINIANMAVRNAGTAQPWLQLTNVKMSTPIETLWGKDRIMNGDVNIDAADLMQVKLSDIHFLLQWENNILTLQPLTASLYNGTLSGVIHGQHFSDVPRWDWHVNFNQIQIKPFLNDVYGTDSKIKLDGVAQISLTANTVGTTREQIISHLQGMGDLTVTHGVVEGVDANYYIESAQALIQHTSQVAPVDTDRTPFDSMTAVAVIHNGIVSTDPLLLTSSEFTVKGTGDIDLLQQSLDYQLEIMPLHIDRIKWAIPVLLSGSLYHPTVKLDVLKVRAMITKDEIEKIKSSVQQQIKALPEKADKLLNKLFR